MPDTAEPALRCRGLQKRFGEVVAVAGIDLEVGAGECFGLLGPNGAGKTTTVEMFEGLTVPDGGTIEVLGQRWGQRDHRLRSQLGVALQETQLPDRLTVEETVRLFRSFYASGRGVDEVVSLLGLEEKRRARVGKLSGGQRQRLALCCALVGAPRVLFLDEPTTGLDPQARLRIWEVIEDFSAAGGTVFLTTHYMEEAARLCRRVAIVDHGKVIAEGSPDALVASLEAEQIVELRAPGLATRALEDLEGVCSVATRGERVVLEVVGVAETLPRILATAEEEGARIEDLATHQATLEDVFVHLTGRALRDG